MFSSHDTIEKKTERILLQSHAGCLHNVNQRYRFQIQRTVFISFLF